MELVLLKDIIAYVYSLRFNKPLDYYQLSNFDNFEDHETIIKTISSKEFEMISSEIKLFFNDKDYKQEFKSIADWLSYIKANLKSQDACFSFPIFSSKDERVSYGKDTLYQQALGLKQVIKECTLISHYNDVELYSSLSLYHPFGIIMRLLFCQDLGKEAIELRNPVNVNSLSNDNKIKIIIASPNVLRLFLNIKLDITNAVIISIGENLGDFIYNKYKEKYNIEIIDLYGACESCILGYRKNVKEEFTLFPNITRKENHLENNEGDKIKQMDELVWNENKFNIGKRIDGAIKLGIQNIYLEDIENIYKEHEDVIDCKLRIKRKANDLSKLIAEITVNKNVIEESFAKEIESWGRRRLNTFQRPIIFIYHYDE